MRGTQIRSVLPLLLLTLASCVCLSNGIFPEEAKQLRDEAREMFYHAFNGYMEHAFPLDELRPLSCAGEDTLGGYALTLVLIPHPIANQISYRLPYYCYYSNSNSNASD